MDQNYKVTYTIDVDSTKGAQGLDNFTKSMEALSKFNGDMKPAVANVKAAMKEIDDVFKTKGGKERNYSYKLDFNTESAEKKFGRIKTALTEIKGLAEGLKVVVNPGQALNTKALKKNAGQAIEQSKEIQRKMAGTTHTTQTALTRSIGKINSALVHLTKGREVNIKTETAKARLNEILGLLNQIRGATGRGMSLSANVTGGAANMARVPFSPLAGYMLPADAQKKLNQRLFTNQALQQQRAVFNRQNTAARIEAENKLYQAKVARQNETRAARQVETDRNRSLVAQQAAQRDMLKQQQQRNVQTVRSMYRSGSSAGRNQMSVQQAAINRLQYSRPPSLRTMLPFAYMLNGYMLFSTMKKELTQAVEYSNIMESARSILRVAEDDLTGFENRFGQMANTVRKVGLETKFTAVEVAGAVKYLAMAGQKMSDIQNSIRPIANLALIGDNDIAQVADLATNIMAGYNIDTRSMPQVADVIASTISRSNVNIIETAESFKMAAGSLRLAGIDFTEASAAIGLLGNAGIKGTMSGTSLRSIVQRLAYQPKEAREILNKLGVSFTHWVDEFGIRKEKIRPLADIFEDLYKKGATLGDMQKIFHRTSANAAMQLAVNHKDLRRDTASHRASHGISGEIAEVKQNTTKGLWYQMTSRFSETFLRGYEIMEPYIQSILKDFLGKFNSEKFAKGLASLGGALLDLFRMLGNIAAWFTNNFHWLGPTMFTGFVATKLFKLAGAVTNLGVAMGFLGKQSVAASGAQLLLSTLGGGGIRLGGGAMSFAARRSLVTTLRAAGVEGGKGAMRNALVGAGLRRGALSAVTQGAASGIFASKVATGRGLVGAGASIAALGGTAVAATAGIAGLVAILGYAAYRTWKLKQIQDSMFEEIKAEGKFRYPSLEALYTSLNTSYKEAMRLKTAVDDLKPDQKLEDVTGVHVGSATSRWFSSGWAGMNADPMVMGTAYNTAHYVSGEDLYNQRLTLSNQKWAERTGNTMIQEMLSEMGGLRDKAEIGAFVKTIGERYRMNYDEVDQSLYEVYTPERRRFRSGLKDMTTSQGVKTYEYMEWHNTHNIKAMQFWGDEYQRLMERQEHAQAAVAMTGVRMSELNQRGFNVKDGQWYQNPLPGNATDEQRETHIINRRIVQSMMSAATGVLRQKWGSAEIAANIMERAGFPSWMYSNEPIQKGFSYEDPDISVTGLDDGGAGGNYSGTGKLSSAAPKQVIVNIGNLLSVETIELLKTPDGSQPEIQDLKELMAQALIDVVHDFDASWNG